MSREATKAKVQGEANDKGQMIRGGAPGGGGRAGGAQQGEANDKGGGGEGRRGAAG